MTKTLTISDECHQEVKVAAAKAGLRLQTYVEEKLCQ